MNNDERMTDNQPEKKGSKAKKTGGFAKFLVISGVILVLLAAGILGLTVYNYTMIQMSANKPTVPTLPTEQTPAVTEAVVEETVAAVEETVPETTLPYTPSGRDIINVLVIGDSSREDESAKLSDTLILASINKKTKTVTLTSFLRDSYVDLPDYKGHTCSWNRINVAYNLGYKWGDLGGALEMTNMTLDLNFGVKVDHNVVVDFDGFMEALVIIGMIPLDLTEAEAAYLNKDLNKALGYPAYNYQAVYEDGSTISWLDPMTCLSYARMRHSDAGDSDIKRSARQRKLITAIIDQIRDNDLQTLLELVKNVAGNVTTDMTDDEILTCIWEIFPMITNLKIESQVIPAEGTYWSKELMVGEYLTYALEFNAKKNREIMMNIAEADQLAITPVG